MAEPLEGQADALHLMKNIMQHCQSIHMRELKVRGYCMDDRAIQLLRKNTEEFKRIQEELDTLWAYIKNDF